MTEEENLVLGGIAYKCGRLETVIFRYFAVITLVTLKVKSKRGGRNKIKQCKTNQETMTTPKLKSIALDYFKFLKTNTFLFIV